MNKKREGRCLERGHCNKKKDSHLTVLSLQCSLWGSRVLMHPHGFFVYTPLTPLIGGIPGFEPKKRNEKGSHF